MKYTNACTKEPEVLPVTFIPTTCSSLLAMSPSPHPSCCSNPTGKLGGQDSFESLESYDSCDRLTQSWSSQSSFQSLQRVPSYDSFDSEDYPVALPNHKPKGTFKDYVRDRADMNKDKPVIPAAALAGYTGKLRKQLGICNMLLICQSKYPPSEIGIACESVSALCIHYFSNPYQYYYLHCLDGMRPKLAYNGLLKATKVSS